MKYPLKISLCGMGGQGIILSAVILGTTAVTQNGLYATQTQSYGSEARGGQCQAELIIDDKSINSPVAEKKDVLIALFQEAYEKYIDTLEEDGILVYDPDLVTNLTRTVDKTYALPATQLATDLGSRMSANMVVLGFVARAFAFYTKEQLIKVVREETNARFLDVNLKAIEVGYDYACTHLDVPQEAVNGSV